MKWGHFIFSAFACARRRAGAGSVLQGNWLTRTVREEPPKSTCALIASRCAAHHARDRKGFNRKPAPQPAHSVALTDCQRTKKVSLPCRLRRRVFERSRQSDCSYPSRAQYGRSSFANERGQARSVRVVRRFRGPCLEIARVVSGAARGVKRAGTLRW